MKIRKPWAAGILILILALAAICPTWAAAELTGEKLLTDSTITMDVTYGYNDTAKSGRYLPMEVTLKNTEDTSFSGLLQVLSMESDYDIYRYDYPVSIEAGAFTKESVDIPLGNRADQLFIRLEDMEGNLVAHRRMKLNINLEIPELFIGVMSDTPEKLEYLNGIGVDYSMLRTQTFSLDASNFPTDETSLDLVDVILISNYKIRNLSSEQSQALVEWVRNGGTMILGTGARVDDTLGRFAPELLDESYDPPEVRQINMGQEDMAGGPEGAVLEIPCADFSLSSANVLFSDGPIALVSSVAYVKGVIAVAAYDFADIEEFCKKNPSYIDTLLTHILGENKISRLAEESYSGNSNQYWSANDTLNAGSVERLPQFSLYVMEIMIYIFLAGPAIYVFLKQRELRKYYRTAIVLLSTVFTAIIYLMGSKTRFDDTFYNYARFVEASEDTISESVYLNMQTPDNKPFILSLDSSYSVKPITRSYYDEGTSVPKFTGEEEAEIAVQYGEEATRILVQDLTAFEPKYFQLDKVVENINGIGFTGEILMKEGVVTGSITNFFEEPMEDVAVLFYDSMILLEDMQPGETKSLDDKELIRIPFGHINPVAEKISGSDRYSQPDITDPDYVHALNKTNLLIANLDYQTGVYTPHARVVAVSSQAERNPLGLSSKEVKGMTIVSSTINVYPYEDGTVYRSALMKTPTIISGSYYSANNTLYGIDPLVLEYSLGNDTQVEKLMFGYVSDEFLDENKSGGLQSFAGSIYFYNHDTGNFDKMSEAQSSFTAQELEHYLSPSNTITIKYINSNVNGYSWDILLPTLNIVGRDY